MLHLSAVPHLAKKDLYDTLGVDKSASQSDIKKAYYKLAKELHPDANRDDPDASKKFAEVAEAYDTLGTEEKRRDYDSGGGEFRNAAGGGFHGQSAEDIFRRFHEQFSGGGSMHFDSNSSQVTAKEKLLACAGHQSFHDVSMLTVSLFSALHTGDDISSQVW